MPTITFNSLPNDPPQYPEWPWPGNFNPPPPNTVLDGIYREPITGHLIHLQGTNIYVEPNPNSWYSGPSQGFTQEFIAGNNTPQPSQPEEEMPAMDKDEIRKRLRRARRGYDLYRDREAEETDCFDFPTYAKLFHGISMKQAEKYWKNGDI